MTRAPYGKRFKLVIKLGLYYYKTKVYGKRYSASVLLGYLINQVNNQDINNNIHEIMDVDILNDKFGFIIDTLKQLKELNDLRLRMEGRTLGLYSDNPLLYEVAKAFDNIGDQESSDNNLVNSIRVVWYTIHDVVKDNLSCVATTINGFSHQVVVKDYISIAFAQWLLDNKHILKYGKVFERNLKNIYNDQVCMGGKYFYVPSDDYLLLVNLSFANDVRKIIRLVNI